MNSIIKIFIDLGIIVSAWFSSFKSPLFSQLKVESKLRSRIILVGNGPSLKQDIDRIIQDRNNAFLYCLNYFASTKIFWQLKPEFYAIIDPMFWRVDVSEGVRKDNKKLFENLKEVNWNLTLLCPKRGKAIIYEELKDNKYIKLVWVSNRAYRFNSTWIYLMALRFKLCTPYFINVMVIALWHAIELDFMNIDIYGADFSNFKNFYVDQKTNIVGSEHTHFYKNSPAQVKANMKYIDSTNKMMYVRLLQCQQAFYQMYLLSLLAKAKHINVLNKSSFSYLDCFNRV